jgi:hypothetical protein
VSEARGGDPLFHKSDVIDYPNAPIEDLENLVDLHPAWTFPVIEDGVSNHNAPFRIDHGNSSFSRWSSRLRTKVALVAAHIAAAFDSVSRVVGNAVSTVVAVAARVIVCLDRLVVGQTLEI